MPEWALSFWQWLQTASQAQATFLGWVVGFITLVVGALINAGLNRARDDRLRREEQRTVAAALRAELVGWREKLQASQDLMSSEKRLIRPGLKARVFPEMVSQLGLLPSATVESLIEAYDEVDWYSEMLSRMKRPELDDLTPPAFVTLTQKPIDLVTRAIAELDRLLSASRPWTIYDLPVLRRFRERMVG